MLYWRFENTTKTSNVNISVYDMNGNFIDQILSNTMIQGNYKIVWNAENLPSGVYFIQLLTGEKQEIQKVVLMK